MLKEMLTQPGRYAYKRGKHKGYDALVQAESFTVWRDIDKDGLRKEDSLVESGYFGINIHAAGTGTKVGNWSEMMSGDLGHGGA